MSDYFREKETEVVKYCVYLPEKETKGCISVTKCVCPGQLKTSTMQFMRCGHPSVSITFEIAPIRIYQNRTLQAIKTIIIHSNHGARFPQSSVHITDDKLYN